MFAPDKATALCVAGRLAQDSMIGEQGIVYRRYRPLETLEMGLNGLPFSNEWRTFFLGETLLAKGFYWSSAEHTIIEQMKEMSQEAIDFVMKVAREARQYANFFVLDVAKTQDGEWILIEVNDGQMSGLSEVDADTLYSNLSRIK